MKTYDKLKEFCEQELTQYSNIESYDITLGEAFEGYDYFNLGIKDSIGNNHYLRIRVNQEILQMEANMYEDVYEPFEYYDYTVKVFWIAFLEWPN